MARTMAAPRRGGRAGAAARRGEDPGRAHQVGGAPAAAPFRGRIAGTSAGLPAFESLRVKTHTLEGLVCVFCLCGKGMSLHSLMTFPNESILLLPMYIF